MWNLLEIAFVQKKKSEGSERSEWRILQRSRSEIYALQPFISRPMNIEIYPMRDDDSSGMMWMFSQSSKKDEILLFSFPIFKPPADVNCNGNCSYDTNEE